MITRLAPTTGLALAQVRGARITEGEISGKENLQLSNSQMLEKTFIKIIFVIIEF
jgi:hypothetical protein